MDDRTFNISWNIFHGKCHVQCSIVHVQSSMMKPDPIVQSAGNSQCYNRYSYCLNNPLKYVDPSGYLVDRHPKDWKQSAFCWYYNPDFSFHSMFSDPVSYSYNWSTGNYENANGTVASWNEVFTNYIAPYSSSYYFNSPINQSQDKNTKQNQNKQYQPVAKGNPLANIKNVLLNTGNMMFEGTLDQLLNSDLVIDLTSTPWMDFALAELAKNVIEIPGAESNARIIEYLKEAGLSGDKLSDETPWCASFVNWCLVMAKIVGAGPRGKDWINWGQSLDGPVYGAIAVFNTGHVGYVIGQNGENLIILHGNWSNTLTESDNIKPSQIAYYRYPPLYIPLNLNP